MATPAQITANRANAQKSTGPRSAEGKSASRFNALKHGIDAASIVIPGEDPAEYEALVAATTTESIRPQSPPKRPSTSIPCSAPTGRSAASNASRPTSTAPSSPNPPDATLAAALLSDSPAAKLLARVQRQIAAFERTWYRANTELRRTREKAVEGQDEALDLLLNAPMPRVPKPDLASFPAPAERPIAAHPSSDSLPHRTLVR